MMLGPSKLGEDGVQIKSHNDKFSSCLDDYVQYRFSTFLDIVQFCSFPFSP